MPKPNDPKKECGNLFAKARIPKIPLSTRKTPNEDRARRRTREMILNSFYETIDELEAGAKVSTKRKRNATEETETLVKWAEENRPRLAPNASEREDLCRATGLSSRQIKGWFIDYQKKER
mmetsp:Transcript_8604/g.25861  ORF Transcript_8604/g.25861 Transcript_8604/m.25861 type:complete len:121 (-) Transcript_8604:1033-1395(-)